MTWGDKVITYKAEDLVPTYSYYISDSTLSEKFGTALASATVSGYQINVGDNYTAEIVIGNSNFEITNPRCDFKIVPVKLTITWKLSESEAEGTNGLTYTYSAANQGPVAVIDAGQVYSADSSSVALTFTYSGTEFAGTSYSSSTCPKNAGNYSVLAATNNTNYIVNAAYETRDFVINKATLEVVWDSNANPFIYNGSDQRISATVTEVKNSESIGNLLYTVYRSGSVTTSYSDAGDYTIKASLNDSVEATKNYVLDETTTGSSFTISPLEITIKWSDTKELTYCGTEIIPEYGYYYGETAITGHEMYYIMGVKESGAQRYVGTEYTARISISNGNYTLTNNTETCSFSIVAKVITITWDATSGSQYTYTAYGISPSATIGADQIYTGDSIGIVYTYTDSGNSSDKPVNVGSYTVTASSSNVNYVISSDITRSFSITAATLEVTWDTVTELTYNGKSQQIYAYVTPFGSDTLELVYTITNATNASDTEHKNAGTYGISVALETDVTNYVLNTNTTNSFTIKPLEVTVVWEGTEIVYEYNGKYQIPSHTYSVPTGSTIETVTDELLGASVTGAIKDVGESKAVISITNGNYSVSNYECSFKIVAKGITVTWSTTELTYSGLDQHPTATIDGGQICYGDSVSVSAYTYTDSLSQHKNAGITYTVEASLDNSNYVILDEYAAKTFKINPKSVTISWTVETFTYDKTGKTPTATITDGVIAADTDSVNIVYTYDDDTADAPVNAGSYTVTASSGNSNYVLSGTNLTVSFTINKATLKLVWPSTTSYVYTGDPIEPTATFASDEQPYSGDVVELQYVYTDGHTDVGSYSVSVSLDNPNYEIDSSSVTTFNYTITPQTVTVTNILWDNTSFTYNGNAQSPEATVTLSESVGYTIGYSYSKADGTTLGGAPTDAGSYTVTITLSSSNYSLNTSGVTLYKSFTIEKATLTVSWTDGDSFTEGSGTMHPVATVSGWASESDVTVKYTYASASDGSYSETEPSSAGNYTVKIELGYDTNNYVVASDNVYEKSYTISAASDGVNA